MTESMASTTAVPRVRKRKDVGSVVNGDRRFKCQNDGCGRSFTRAEHLQRHLLNHSTGEFTCSRCRAHFKRKDLLDRHMARHRQKDEEVGAEGRGILNTRKRMWKDADGNIVTKKPSLGERYYPPPSPNGAILGSNVADFVQNSHDNGAPISPPLSHDPSHGLPTFDNNQSGIALGYHSMDSNALSNTEPLSPIDQRFWSSNLPQHEPQPQPQHEQFNPFTFDDAPFEDIFNPDTASSFNNPFTTRDNYNWLFDLELPRTVPNQSAHLAPDPHPAYQFPGHTVNEPIHAYDLQLDNQIPSDNTFSFTAINSSHSSHSTNPPQQSSPAAPLISPPLTEERHNTGQNSTIPTQQPPATVQVLPRAKHTNTVPQLAEIERPISMLHPSCSLPVVDELARQQFLDLIDITQPVSPDGSLVMRDHPLLSLSCLQTYSDLFFTRFNTTYPLVHLSTFDPSHADTLFLAAVLLLGATYGDKDAHQLAVCVHDVLRPQIFANAGFSDKPDLWVLQTMLLVECFGKSRAGQKQHDMSHLFHGLLINLIRRSDCQKIRPPAADDATEDLEEDWRTWVEAEQKKRLAFLCFMWDTQHAVLFCQSLCMSAVELISTLPCDQSLWEAPSAESWHRLRKTQPPSPLFLSCLKVYLNPTAAQVPKNLNALSRSLLLHGLMSISWDMQRRDQTSLGVLDTNPIGDWKTRLAASYDAWHSDFASYCSTYEAQLSQLPESPRLNHDTLSSEFTAFKTSVLALYHAAHILLHTPFLDLQIYAGARHILGKAVARADYARSSRIVKTWVAGNAKQAGRAVWHAAALVERGVDVLDGESSELGVGRLWHLPWAVYLGTLVVWGVWYARPLASAAGQGGSRDEGEDADEDEDEDEMVWDAGAEMRGLLERILKSEPERLLEAGAGGFGGGAGITGAVGRRGAMGLVARVSGCLGKVRWAVVHDGMVVLRGLVSWRLVGGAGAGGGVG